MGVVGYYFYNNIQDTLVYQWRWEDLWSYFFSWHPEKKIWFFNTLSLGRLILELFHPFLTAKPSNHSCSTSFLNNTSGFL